MRTNGVRYSQVFARILENAGKQQKVILVTAQVNFKKMVFDVIFSISDVTNQRCIILVKLGGLSYLFTLLFRGLDRKKM